MPVVRTDGLSGGRSVGVRSRDYQLFSRMGRSLHFLTYGAPLARVARESSAINWSNNCLKELCETLLNRANSSTYSQKAPAVTWFGLFYFTREEPGTVQKEIELWDSFKGPNRSHWLLQGWAGNWVKIRYPPTYLPPPSKPSNSDIRHSTDPVHVLKDSKIANVWTIILNTSRN